MTDQNYERATQIRSDVTEINEILGRISQNEGVYREDIELENITIDGELLGPVQYPKLKLSIITALHKRLGELRKEYRSL